MHRLVPRGFLTPVIMMLPQSDSQEDRYRILELLNHRALQLCLFLSALVGQQQMESVVISAIRNSRVVAAQSD